jgi:hypothetical protein
MARRRRRHSWRSFRRESKSEAMSRSESEALEGDVSMYRYEYKVIDTGKDLEQPLNALGAQGWQVVGVTTKKQLLIAPPQAIILMRQLQTSDEAHETTSLAHARA